MIQRQRAIGPIPSSGFVPGAIIGPVPGGAPYTGFLDAIETPASFVMSNQKAYSDYADDNSIIRVDATPSTIGFSNNLFDSTAWDTAVGPEVDIVTDGKEFESGWGGMGGGLVNRATSPVKFGTYSLESECPVRFDGFQTAVNIPVVAGDSYRVAMWVYGNGVNKITLRTINASNVNDQYSDEGSGGFTYPAEWTLVEWEFTAIATENLRMQGYNNTAAAGTFYIDDVYIYAGKTAYGTTVYGQIDEVDVVQATELVQPSVLRLGESKFNNAEYYKNTSFPAPTTKFSFMVNINLDNFAANQGIIAQDDFVERQWSCQVTSSDQIKFTARIGGVGPFVTIDNAESKLQGRHMLGMSYDSVTGIKMYIDGIETTVTGTLTGVINTGTADFTIGSFSDGSSPLVGEVGTVATFNETLSDQDHLDAYNQYISNLGIDLAVKAGQSNMTGRPTDYLTVSPPVVPIDQGYFFNQTSKRIETFVAPEGDAVGGSSMSNTCIAYYNKTGRRLLIVEGSWPGSGMTAESEATYNWASGVTYNYFLNNAKAAEMYTGLKVKFILWAQGEQDSYDITNVGNTNITIYEAGFNDLLDRFDTEFDTPTVIISKLGNSSAGTGTSDTAIRGVQDTIASERANVHIGFSDADTFQTGHYLQGEYNTMGTAMGSKAADLI